MIKFVSLSTSGDHFKKTEKSIHGEFSLISAHLLQKNPEGAFLYKHFKLGGKTIKFFEDKKKFASQYGALVRVCSTFSTFRVTKLTYMDIYIPL